MLLGLAWMESWLAEFMLVDERRDIQTFDKRDIARLKPLSELALCLAVIDRCGVKIPFVRRTAEWAWARCGHGEHLLRLLLARNDFLPGCSLYASLSHFGFRSTALDAAVLTLSRTRMAERLPLQPWSKLALAYNLWQLGIADAPAQDDRSLYIDARPEPWIIPGEIAYAITHEVFFLTDFGFRPIASDALREYLSFWIPYWSGIFVAERDWDISGEWAMCWSCLRRPFEGKHERILASVLEAQAPDGHVAGPEGAGGILFAPGDSPSRRHFLARYHTTLVAVMAAGMALRAEKNDPAT